MLIILSDHKSINYPKVFIGFWKNNLAQNQKFLISYLFQNTNLHIVKNAYQKHKRIGVQFHNKKWWCNEIQEFHMHIVS